MIDVLNLEWASFPSRDRQMATLVCNYLRLKGYNVLEASVFNGLYLLDTLRPKIFFICNTQGARINYELMKYAKYKGIKGVSLISEGNFLESKEKAVQQFVWGWNSEKILDEELFMQWSERTRNLTLRYYPELEGRIKVSGGVGFDIYKISHNFDKDKLISKYTSESYSKIIGVGCWDFGIFYSSDHRFPLACESYTEKERNRFITDQNLFNNILEDVIVNNPRILFLLKEHPGCLGGRSASAIEGLEKFTNTLILKNEESIIDCIDISDFWISYESTSALEAWLLNKQTCLLNPSGTDFKRANVYLGSPNYPNAQALQNAIDNFYLNGCLPDFKELEYERKRIIKETIQWDDGLNHVRAGNEIIDILENYKCANLKNDSLYYAKKKYQQMIFWHLSPYLSFFKKFKFYAEHVKAFNKKELKDFQQKRMNEQIAFYKKNKLQKEDLRNIKCI